MIAAAINKEFKLVFRDRHSLFVLFVMPAIFILIMSLALQEQFSRTATPTIELFYLDQQQSELSQLFVQHLSDGNIFSLNVLDRAYESDELLNLLDDEQDVYLLIPADFDSLFEMQESNTSIEISFLPNISPPIGIIVESSIKQALTTTQLTYLSNSAPVLETLLSSNNDHQVTTNYLYSNNDKNETPSSVQQNVPAWLIFSMFFVVIPISTTLLTEKQQGTLLRLKTMNVSLASFLFAKSLPYLVINQLQLIIMLIIGVYIIPLFNGERLIIDSNYFSLMLVSLAIGIAALGYALFIAAIAKSIEQATTIGGVGNILFGAIGGIMVPRFIMPDYLQDISVISPMSWALDAFLEIFLYGSNALDLLTEISLLLLFGIIMFTISLTILTKSYNS